MYGPLATTFGISTWVVWYIYVRRATAVFIDRGEIFARIGRDLMRVPLRQVVAVRKAPLIRRPPLIIKFKRDDDSLQEILFIPSIRESGFFFGAEQMQELIEREVRNYRLRD